MLGCSVGGEGSSGMKAEGDRVGGGVMQRIL